MGSPGVRVYPAGKRHGILASATFANHCDVFGGGEHRFESGANDLVIVNQHNAN